MPTDIMRAEVRIDYHTIDCATIMVYYNCQIQVCQSFLLFEFPHFAIHRAKRFPSQSDGSTLHIKALWNASFPDAFCARCLCCQRQQGLLVQYYKKWGNSNFFYFPVNATVSRAIASSSLVGMHNTATLEPGVEITFSSPRTWFAASSISTPR